MPPGRHLLLCMLSCCCPGRMSRTEGRSRSPAPQFPASLAGFKLGWTEAGQLRQLREDGGVGEEAFQFNVSDKHQYNQARYEAVGELVTEYVYTRLEEVGLERRPLPGTTADTGFVFASPDCGTADRLLVLIHGSGVVRAGQWTRKLIINEDLDKGSMLPDIERAREGGWAVLVLNTNHNTGLDGSTLEGSGSPEEHAESAWKALVQHSSARNVAILAHSYGGVVSMALAAKFKQDFMERVSAVLLTDSVHYRMAGDAEVDRKLELVGRNYVASDKPAGEALTSARRGLERVSAGHSQHEWTTWAARHLLHAELDRVAQSAGGDLETAVITTGNGVNEEKNKKSEEL